MLEKTQIEKFTTIHPVGFERMDKHEEVNTSFLASVVRMDPDHASRQPK
jgi:hypothetical protein